MTIDLINLSIVVMATWFVILVVGVCAVLASRRRDRMAEARIEASHRALIKAQGE